MIRNLHRGLAIVLGLFLALHLGNHLAGFWGQDTHLALQSVLRQIYRHPWIEPLLLAALAIQAGLGTVLLARQRRLTLQTASGAWLALFVMMHVGAVLTARWQGTDTTLAFAAAGLHAPFLWPQLFAAYFGLAVFAVFAHLSVPLARRHTTFGHLLPAAGIAIAVALILLLAGWVTPLTIPSALIAAFP